MSASTMLDLKQRLARLSEEERRTAAAYPYQPGDYESPDDSGRTLQHLRAGNLVISYWPDDWCRELRSWKSKSFEVKSLRPLRPLVQTRIESV